MTSLAHAPGAAPSHPPLIIRERDEHRLHEIAIGAMLSSPRLAGGLLDELTRAEVRPDAQAPPDVIGLGALATYLDSDGVREVLRRDRIVAPEDADACAGRLSVLSDLGAALLGLGPGQSILWRNRRGGMRQVTVVAVEPQAAPDDAIGAGEGMVDAAGIEPATPTMST